MKTTTTFLSKTINLIFDFCKGNDFQFVIDGALHSSSEAGMREIAMSFIREDSKAELLYESDPFEIGKFDKEFSLLSDQIKTGNEIYAVKNSDGTYMCLAVKIDDDIVEFLSYAKSNGFIDELSDYRRVYPDFPDNETDYSNAVVLISKEYICIELGFSGVFSLYPRPDFNLESAIEQECAGWDY